MIGVTDLKAGTTFLYGNKPYKVLKYFHQKMGRGGANVKVTARNLETGNMEEKTFGSNLKIEEISTIKRQLQYLYADKANATFMDPASFDQVEIPVSIVEDELRFVKEGQMASVVFWDDRPLSIEISPKATLTVTDTPPGIKGNSATNMFKQAEVENGSLVKVPLFINKGDKVVVDTRTGEYVERAK